MREVRLRRSARRGHPGSHSPAPLPRHRQMAHDQHDRAGEQGLGDPAGGGLRLAADHDEREDEDRDDGGLRGEVPGGHGDERPADGDERDEPLGPRQHEREPGEDQRPEDGSGGPAQDPGDERSEVGLDEEDGGGGQPVPVRVLPVPVGVVQRLRDGGAYPEAEGDPQSVLPAMRPRGRTAARPGR